MIPTFNGLASAQKVNPDFCRELFLKDTDSESTQNPVKGTVGILVHWCQKTPTIQSTIFNAQGNISKWCLLILAFKQEKEIALKNQAHSSGSFGGGQSNRPITDNVSQFVVVPRGGISRSLLRASELSKIVGLAPFTLKKYANLKRIRGHKVSSRLWLFDPEEVIEDLKKGYSFDSNNGHRPAKPSKGGSHVN